MSPTPKSMVRGAAIARHQQRKRDGHRERTIMFGNWMLYPQGSCWCGQRYRHDWAGKADGEPHPRWWNSAVHPVGCAS